MESGFVASLSASILAATFTASGIWVIRRFEAWAKRSATYFVCFAAGALIAASFLHLIPKALAMSPAAPTFLLLGFVALHLYSRFLTSHVCERGASNTSALGLVSLAGISFHSLLDGVVYAITFSVDAFTGSMAAVGMVLHEFPEGVITYLLLLRSGYDTRRAFWLALLGAGLSTPLGTLVSYPFISDIEHRMLGELLALSAGALLYVGATHLLPRAEQESRRYSLLALGGGMLIAAAVLLAEPH